MPTQVDAMTSEDVDTAWQQLTDSVVRLQIFRDDDASIGGMISNSVASICSQFGSIALLGGPLAVAVRLARHIVLHDGDDAEFAIQLPPPFSNLDADGLNLYRRVLDQVVSLAGSIELNCREEMHAAARVLLADVGYKAAAEACCAAWLGLTRRGADLGVGLSFCGLDAHGVGSCLSRFDIAAWEAYEAIELAKQCVIFLIEGQVAEARSIIEEVIDDWNKVSGLARCFSYLRFPQGSDLSTDRTAILSNHEHLLSIEDDALLVAALFEMAQYTQRSLGS